MSRGVAAANRVVVGYVVKRETIEKERGGAGAERKVRKEISRVFHAVSAAESFLALAKKSNPDWDLYIHEKTGVPE